MRTVVNLNKTDSITKKDGMQHDRFAAWASLVTENINKLIPLSGTGSPEGVVVGFISQIYFDTDASAGTGLYHKEADDGLNTGWVARS